MENSTTQKAVSEVRKKMFEKNVSRVSSSGRKIFTPKYILSTSDEKPSRKKSKNSSTVQASLGELKNLAAKLLKQKVQPDKFDQRNEATDKEQRLNSTLLQREVMVADASPKTPTSVTASIKDKHKARWDHPSASSRNSYDAGNNYLAQALSSTLFKKEVEPTDSPPKSPAAVIPEIVNKYMESRNHPSVFSKHLPDIRNNSLSKVTECISSPFTPDEPGDNRDYINGNSIRDKEKRTEEKSVAGPHDSLNLNLALQKIFETLTNIERQNEVEIRQNKEILQLLSHLNLCKEELSNTLYEPLKGFPINTVAEFQELDSHENKETRQKVHNHLLRLGGCKLKDFLSCALKEVMTDELVSKFTWHKTKESAKFGDTKVSNVFYQAALKCPYFPGPENKQVFKQAMLDVLKSTKQRCRNKLKNRELQAKPDLEAEEINNRIRESQQQLTFLTRRRKV